MRGGVVGLEADRLLIARGRGGLIVLQQKHVAARGVCVGEIGFEDQRLIEVCRRLDKVAGLTEQGPEQIMRVDIAGIKRSEERRVGKECRL